MALSTENYGYLIDPFLPLTDEHGNTIKDGFVRVFMAGTSTPATTYANFDGTLNPELIELDNSGRTANSVIADKSRLYKVCVFDAEHSQESPIVTKDNLSVISGGSGGGGGGTYTADAPIRIFGDRITNNGNNLEVSGTWSWAEGDSTKAKSIASHSEGTQTEASDVAAHAEGYGAKASGVASHAEGGGTTASGALSHAEGNETVASGSGSHAEGYETLSSSAASHAEGIETEASQGAAHAEGMKTKATGAASHAEGEETIASGANSHAGGQFSQASGQNSFAHGLGVVAVNGEAAFGKYNDYEAPDTRLFSVGGGTDDSHRKTVFKVDASGITWVMIDGVLKQVTSVGSHIYETLQDAITDAANLSVGDFFETNGFHASGDGGAARYLVSNTGTANGMDIVHLAAGKLAIVQLKGSAYTEQIGYVVNSSQADVVPYIKRLFAMGIQTVRFYPTGSAPTACYCIRDMLDLDRSDFHNVGVKLEGADIGQTSGYATWFNFQPSVSNTDKIAIKIHARTTRIENIALVYGAGTSDTSVRGTSAAICFDSTGNSSYQTSSYGTVLKNLTIQGFNTAILSMGSAPYIWHVDCEKITCSSNNTHVSLDGLSYCTTFRNCLFNSPDVQSVYLGEPFTVKFDSCNFGIDDRATTIIRSVNWVIAEAPVDERFGSVLFTNCNMEVEYRNTSVPQNNRHLFFYADDDSKIKYELDNCTFIVTPLAREYVTTDRMVSLGSGSEMILRNSIGPYADVNYTGNEFYEKDYDKYFFDESRFPEKKVGSIRIEHCVGIDPLVFLDSDHLPCLKKDDGVILCDNDTDLTEFNGIGDGTTLFNLDTFIPYVKVAGKLQPCASAPSGVVRIGNELYDYVTIDGLKWITRNLNLRLTTRQHTIFGHYDYGQYYKYSDLSAVSAELPTGWRIPNATDIASIVGDGTSTRAHNLQSLGVSFWPSATDSTGFSALPSMFWYKPNTEPHPTYKEYAFYWTTATEGTDVKNIEITPDSVSSGTFTSEDASTLWIPLRVCADA